MKRFESISSNITFFCDIKTCLFRRVNFSAIPLLIYMNDSSKTSNKVDSTSMLMISVSLINIIMLKKQKKFYLKNSRHSMNGLQTINYQFNLGLIKQKQSKILDKIQHSIRRLLSKT